MIKNVSFDATENVTTIHIDAKRSEGWSQWFLISSDRHWDNPDSDHKLQKKHLDEAKAKGAGVIDLGDLLCLMQGKYDPRSSKSKVRPEHQVDDYLDAVIETACEFFKPYKDNFIQIGRGNHETAILKRHETDMTKRLCTKLGVIAAGYSGWVVFTFKFGNSIETKKMFFHHGYGGDAPVTKGTIQTARMGLVYPDANIIVSGHTHNSWVFPISRFRIGQNGSTYYDEQVHVKIPTYKEEYKKGVGGWHVERGAPPKPLGAYWVKFYIDRKNRVRFQVVAADL